MSDGQVLPGTAKLASRYVLDVDAKTGAKVEAHLILTLL